MVAIGRVSLIIQNMCYFELFVQRMRKKILPMGNLLVRKSFEKCCWFVFVQVNAKERGRSIYFRKAFEERDAI